MSKAFPTIPYSTTLHVRDHCLCLHTQRAARALARRFDEAFRPFDLTSGQFSLMMSLNRPLPASLGSVASVLGMNRTTLTAALKPLQRRGLVVSRPKPGDARVQLLSLTEAGEALLTRAAEVWSSTHEALERGLGEGVDDLRASLRAVEAA